MDRRTWIGAVALGGLGLRAGQAAPSKAAAERDAFYKDGKVLRLAIEIAPKEMESLRRDARKYVKATLREGDKTVADVGVHLRGAAGSFRGVDDKPGLTLNADKFVDGQRFRGMDKFHLANSAQDSTYLCELICGELFRAAGVPAARVGHALVTINGKKKGLYYLKEGYDKDFIRENLGDPNGNFYDGGFLRDLDQPLQLLSGSGDVMNQAELKALVAACRNEPDVTKRFAKIEKLLDVDKFTAFVALDVACCDWDGYPLNRNNYRVYHDPKRDKIVFLPSGLDQMFGDTNAALLPGFQGLVASALFGLPKGRELYLAKMADLLKTVFKPDPLLKRLDELQARVQPALAEVDAGAGKDYPNQVNRLRHAIPERAKNLNEQMKRTKK